MNTELPQTLPSFDSAPRISKPNFVDEPSNIFNPPPQHLIHSCEFCGNDAYFGHYCFPKAQFNDPEQGYSQDFNFPQNIQKFQQQYFCCDQCGGPHETSQCQQVNFFEPCCEYCGGPHENFQCQPVNYCEPNPSYGSYYPGYDQVGDFLPQQYLCCENYGGPHETFHCQPPQCTVDHPIFDAQNELLTSQNKLMEQMTQLTSMCELACQIIQKKQEEKRIEEEQAANARYWKIPACCDDDDDYNFAITPILSTQFEEQEASARYWKIPACCDDDEDYDSAITPILSTEEPIDSLICPVFSETLKLLPKDFILQVFISSASIGNQVSKSYRLTFFFWHT
nr:hypothetical protein [Tanacetum cinerariifolium]